MARTEHILLLLLLLWSAFTGCRTQRQDDRPHDWLTVAERVRQADIIVIGRLSRTTRTHFANSEVVVKRVLKGQVGQEPLKVGYFYGEATTESDAPWHQDHILFLRMWEVEAPGGVLWTKFVGRTVRDDTDGSVQIVSRDYNGLLPATEENVALVTGLLRANGSPGE